MQNGALSSSASAAIHANNASGSSNPNSNGNDADEYDEVVFVADPFGPLLCRIHGGVMRDPVIAKCGHSFCRQCISKKISTIGKCPVDEINLGDSDLWPNLALAEQIGDLQVYCKYHKPNPRNKSETNGFTNEGCKAILKLKDRAKHEMECDYSPISCPNSLDCPPLLRLELKDHLKKCPNTPCDHVKHGCKFKGTRSEVAAHLKDCRYEGVKDLLNERDIKIQELEDLIISRNEQVDTLHRIVENLSLRIEKLEKAQAASSKEGSLRRKNSVRNTVINSEIVPEQHFSDQQFIEHSEPKEVDLQNHKYKCVGTYVGHTGPVWALALKGDMIFSGSSDLTIKGWDCNRQVCVQTLTGHEGIVHAVEIIGNKLYSASSDCTIKVWSLETSEMLKSVQGSDNTVCTLASYSTGTRSLLFSGSLKVVRVWDTSDMSIVTELKGHNHWVRALVVSEARLYSGSYNMIKIWALDSFECIRTITCQGGSVYSLAVDLIGQNLISGIYENRIDLWDLKTFQSKGSLHGHSATVYAVAVSNHGPNRLFSGSYDTTVKIWNLETFQCVQTLNRHTSSVDAIVVGKGKIYSAAADNQIKVWA